MFMGNSQIIIAVVVGIVVLKLVAVHLYLKKKMDESDNSKESSQENKDHKD